MKKNSITHALLVLSLFWMISLFPSALYAQKEIVRETRSLPAFEQIEIGGAFEVRITAGSPQTVEVESRQKDIGKIAAEVKENKLVVSAKGITGNSALNIYITTPALTRIEAHGAADLRGMNALKADMLSLEASGAASVDLIVDVATLSTEVSGAADVHLTGQAGTHSARVSGAGSLEASELLTVNTDADVSGAATAHVNAENLTGQTSGAGEIYSQDTKRSKSGGEQIWIDVDDESDTTYVHVPGTGIVVSEKEDSVTVKIGNRVIVVDEDGEIRTRHHKWPKFNGHWAGFDIGFNGYITPYFNMDFEKQYEYLDLRMEKSIATSLNFFEQNIPLAKNQKWGIITGLGLGFNDYRFMRPTRLSMDSSSLKGYLYEDISIRKSKLSAIYLSLPVLFEFQTAPAYHKNGFHINLGVLISARLSSHTKVYYNELNTDFSLEEYIPDPVNPDQGNYEVVFTGVSPNDPKEHHYGDWFLQPFKFEATARIGWNFLNFWTNFSMNTMFRKDRGPELYPWSAGITLVCF